MVHRRSEMSAPSKPFALHFTVRVLEVRPSINAICALFIFLLSCSKFGIVFEKIAYNEKIPVKHMGFDKATVEIDRDDLETFMKSIGRYMR